MVEKFDFLVVVEISVCETGSCQCYCGCAIHGFGTENRCTSIEGRNGLNGFFILMNWKCALVISDEGDGWVGLVVVFDIAFYQHYIKMGLGKFL